MTVTNRRIPRLSAHRTQLTTATHFQQATGGGTVTGTASAAGTSVASNASNEGIVFASGAADEDNPYSYAPFPKHVPFPNVEQSSELLNEFLIFGFTIVASATQFLQLYRTVWWLPNSYTRQAVNFYLIDWDLAIFIYVMASRRLLYCCILKLIDLNCPEAYVDISKKIAKYVFLACVIISFVGCGIQIFQKNSYLYLFCLSYPFVLYLAIFGFNLEQFLRTIVDTEANCINGMPLHSCSSSATSVRSEIDSLKTDFNNRFKQIIFTSVLNAYYSGFVPCILVPKHLYYDILRATQHLGFIFVGGFTMCVAYCFPVRYCDVFHRAALHLGQWTHVSHRSSNMPPCTWSKTSIFPFGTNVRHMGEVYRSVGYCTSAIPANNSHSRFYTIFKNPVPIYLVLLCFQLTVVGLQLILLVLSREWHNLISVGFLLLTNYFTLFRIFRDYLIARRVYAGENLLHERYKVQ